MLADNGTRKTVQMSLRNDLMESKTMCEWERAACNINLEEKKNKECFNSPYAFLLRQCSFLVDFCRSCSCNGVRTFKLVQIKYFFLYIFVLFALSFCSMIIITVVCFVSAVHCELIWVCYFCFVHCHCSVTLFVLSSILLFAICVFVVVVSSSSLCISLNAFQFCIFFLLPRFWHFHFEWKFFV